MFDPETFLATNINDAMSTKVVPIPEGMWKAQISEIGARSGEKDGKGWASLDLTWEILDDELKKKLNRDKVTCRQQMFLDLTPEGGLDFSEGRNVSLGRVREALGQNKKGRPWAPSHLKGGVAVVQIKHRTHEGETYSDVIRCFDPNTATKVGGRDQQGRRTAA